MTNAENRDDKAETTALRELMAKMEAAAAGPPPSAFDQLAFTALAASGAGPKAVFAALARLRETFVDWNDLRFSRVADLADVLSGIPEPEHTARHLRAVYRKQFDESGRMDLHFPDDARAADVKKKLGRLFPSLGKTAIAYILYEYLPGQPLPLSDGALAAAKKQGAVPKAGQRAQLQKKLEDALMPGEIVRFVQLLEMLGSDNHPHGETWPAPPDPEELKKKAKKKK